MKMISFHKDVMHFLSYLSRVLDGTKLCICCISLTSQKTRRLDGSAIFFEQKESHHVVTCLFFNKENPDVTNSIFLSFKNQIFHVY